MHVCIRNKNGKKIESETAVFATFTRILSGCSINLRTHNIRRVVMESTGSEAALAPTIWNIAVEW